MKKILTLLRTKKAEESFRMLWNRFMNLVILFGIIFLTLIAFIYAVSNSEFFERTYLSMDLALTNEAILSNNNDLIFIYDKEMKDFSYINDDSRVIIKKENSLSSSAYVNNPSYLIENKELNPLYEKNNKKINFIPIKLLITKISNRIDFINLKENLIDLNEN